MHEVVTVDGGWGDYYDYSDRSESSGTYEILTVDTHQVRFRANVKWTFSGSDGATDSGRIRGVFTFDRVERTYVGDNDLGEAYAGANSSTLAVWFHIEHIPALGGSVPSSDQQLSVAEPHAVVWRGATPLESTRLVDRGGFERNDSYGTAYATYSNTLYFDPHTGYLITADYSEDDEGIDFIGGFHLHTVTEITPQSFGFQVSWWMVGATYGLGLGVLFVVIGLVVHRRYGPRRVRLVTFDGTTVRPKLRRLGTGQGIHHLRLSFRSYYSPFVAEMVERAAEAKERVWIALDGEALRGVVIGDRESRTVSLYADDPRLADELLRYSRSRDFFSEIGLEGTRVETYDLYVGGTRARLGFDGQLVRPATPKDGPAIVTLAKSVYGVAVQRWVDRTLTSDDLAFVAEYQGAIVGFGFCNISPQLGRLYGLTVHPTWRNRGVGADLVKARIEALAALGIPQALTEVATWNTPSARIYQQLGFTVAGQSFLTSRGQSRGGSPVFRR